MQNPRAFFPGIWFRFLVCISATVLIVPIAKAAEAPPNVVLLMADDLGWGDVGFNGNKVIRTPHLDAMAASGLRFERFYAAAPVCSPTRGSCLTGRHPYRYGILGANVGHLPAQELTLAELLQARGYMTGHFGKWHLGTLSKTERDSNRGGRKGSSHYSPPELHGFEMAFSTEAKVPTWDPMLRPKDSKAKPDTWWDPLRDPGDAQPYGTAYWSLGRKVEKDLRGDDSQIVMDRALPFIRTAVDRERPFFAVIWFHAPHLPVVAGPEMTALYPDCDKHRQHYYGCITALDAQVGRLREALREAGVAQNTLVWFCSDNGPEGNEEAPGSTGPLRGRKRSLNEGGVRVPGLLEWPARIQEARTTAVPACTSDYLPTLIELLDIPLTDSRPIDGISLLPVIDGKVHERSEPIAFESRGQLAVIDDRFKLVYVPASGRGANDEVGETVELDFELYDLVADPGEQNDLAAEHPEIVDELAHYLDTWRKSCAASRGGVDYELVPR